MVKASLAGVIVRNRLAYPLEKVEVVFGDSKKSTGLWAYTTDWRTVDIENDRSSGLIEKRYDLKVGTVEKDGETSTTKEIPFDDDYRGYWQVYFWMKGSKFSINKNNAQCNPWAIDGGSYAEITIREEAEDSIRADFVLKSGNAYFYCHKCLNA